MGIPFFGTMLKLSTPQCPGPVEILRPVAFCCRFVVSDPANDDGDFEPEAA